MITTAPEKKPMLEFEWDAAFESALVKLLLDYRTSEKATSNPHSHFEFERALARDFAQRLRSLIESHVPSLAADSDITACVESMKRAHDAAETRVLHR